MSFTFEAAKAGYGNLWRSMTIRPERRAAIQTAARKILAGKSRYLGIERTTGVPWFVIGLVHDRESDCNFATHLHNGDSLSARTYHKPAGRPISGSPPFTFEESARDALSVDGLNKITDWSIERILYMEEAFNGFGYVAHNVNSPYVWGGSNHYGDRGEPGEEGKYTSDGHFDPYYIDTQLGCAPLLATMMEMDASIALWLKTDTHPVPPPPDVPPIQKPVQPKPPVTKPVVRHASGAVVVAGGTVIAAHYLGVHPALIFAIAVAAFIGYAIFMSKRK